ncbi:hypothetical protein ACSQ67_019971 [Phaseolus vulgaris]
MGLKGSACVALFLSLNLLSLSIVTSQLFINCSVKLSQVPECSTLEDGSGSIDECCNALVRMGLQPIEASGCVDDAITRGLQKNTPPGVSFNISIVPRCGSGF